MQKKILVCDEVFSDKVLYAFKNWSLTQLQYERLDVAYRVSILYTVRMMAFIFVPWLIRPLKE